MLDSTQQLGRRLSGIEIGCRRFFSCFADRRFNRQFAASARDTVLFVRETVFIQTAINEFHIMDANSQRYSTRVLKHRTEEEEKFHI